MSENWLSELEPGGKTLAVSNLIRFFFLNLISCYMKRGYGWVIFILPKTIIQKIDLNSEWGWQEDEYCPSMEYVNMFKKR